MAVATLGGPQPNTGTSVPASVTSGDHDLLEASWWKAVGEKRENNWCLTLALSVTEWFSKQLTLSCAGLRWRFPGRNKQGLLIYL